ncbi:MAG: ABC exporter membrane fusion protein [Cyanobacteria bacterium J06614_10]
MDMRATNVNAANVNAANINAVKVPALGRSSRRWAVVIGVLLLGAVGLVQWRLWQARVAEIRAEQTEAIAPEITTVTALGRLEPTGELVRITAPTSVQESRIGELQVAEGEAVSAGEVIAVLDNRDLLQVALQRAEQQVEVARAQLAQVQAGAQSGEIQAQQAEISRLQAERLGNIETQRATIARIQAEVNNARDDFARYESLYQRGGISASERDSYRLTLTTAEQQLAEAKATLSRIETTSNQQISQARATLDRIAEVRPVDVEIAEAEVRSAMIAVTEAQANLDQAYVKSPINGRVIDIHTKEGETVGSDGIATVGQTQQMMAVVEVYQDDIHKIEVGQSVVMTSTAIDDTLRGTVERIGLQIGQQQVVNEDPSANIDAKVVEVFVRLNEASSDRVAGLTNLQVTAKISFQ